MAKEGHRRCALGITVQWAKSAQGGLGRRLRLTRARRRWLVAAVEDGKKRSSRRQQQSMAQPPHAPCAANQALQQHASPRRPRVPADAASAALHGVMPQPSQALAATRSMPRASGASRAEVLRMWRHAPTARACPVRADAPLLPLPRSFADNGRPADERLYVFDGDFVDRGAWGLEVGGVAHAPAAQAGTAEAPAACACTAHPLLRP